MAGGTSEVARTVRASQYASTVNLFIENRWLRLERAENGDTSDAKRAAPLIRFEPPADSAQAAVAREFFESSFLRSDVQAFNNARLPQDLLRFRYVGEQLASIDPNAHVFRSPQFRRGKWVGQLLYARSTAIRNLSLQALDGGDPSVEVEELCEPLQNEVHKTQIDLFTGRSASEARGAIVRFEVPGIGPVAQVWRMGDGMLLKMEVGASAEVSARINGRQVEKSPGKIFHLPRNSVLLFEDTAVDQRGRERRHAWIVRDSDDPDVIYDARGSLWRNTGRNPLMPRLVRVLSVMGANDGPDVDAAVTLTLLRTVDESAARILRKNAEPAQAGTAGAPAAITLMDATNGALLALPSWPEIDERGLAEVDAESAPANHNFTRLAIGSVAKVLVAAPILDTHTQLLSLKINARDDKEFDSVLGIPLGRAIKDSRHGSVLDLRSGIYASSNRFAISLLTIGSDDPGLATAGSRVIDRQFDWYSLGGPMLEARPPHLLFEPDGRDPIFTAQSLSWVRRMTELYDIYAASTEVQPDKVTRQYIWSYLPPSLQSREDSRLLDTVSPEYENLRLEALRRRDFSTVFVPIVLGGGESRWTNVAVAESFATLVLNRPIRAFLVLPPKGQRPDPVRGQRWRRLKTDVHGALLQALSDVPYRGTARSVLNDTRSELAKAACAKNEAFALFGKTGTPELEESVPSPGALLFNQMADAGLFQSDRVTKQVSYTAYAGSPLSAKDLLALREQRKQGGVLAEHFEKYFANPSEAVRVSARRCRESLNGEKLWDAVMREIVVNHNLAPEDRTIQNIGAALRSNGDCPVLEGKSRFGAHFAFVAAVYGRDAVIGGTRQDCTSGTPAPIDFGKAPRAAIAGVVAITDPQLGTGAALRTAQELLRGPVAKQLGLPESDSAEESK